MQQQNQNARPRAGARPTTSARIPREQRAAFRQARLQTNVGRMYVFSIYIIALQILLNVINILRPSDGETSNIMIYVFLSLGTLAVGIVYWLLLLLVRRGKIKSPAAQSILVTSLLYLYLGIQLTFCTLNIISTGGFNSYIIAILIVGMVPIIPPVQSILSIALSYAYVMVVSYLTRGVSAAWDSIMLTDLWTNLIIITGLTACISIFIYRMYAANFLKNLDLQARNAELEERNAEIAQVNERLEVIANTDQMTGVFNRRALSLDLERLWQTPNIKHDDVAFAIFDIDFFKAYNDTFGHIAGDECLQKVAASLEGSFRRADDIVYRYGGEEFLVVFNAGGQDAISMVENACRRVEQLRIPHATTAVSPYVTVSAGVCLMEHAPGRSIDRALKIADDALYASKDSGRNRTSSRPYVDA